MKLEFSRQIFEKTPNIKFHENPSSGSRVISYEGRTGGRTDRYEEANSHFPQFCKLRSILTVFLHTNTPIARLQILSYSPFINRPSSRRCVVFELLTASLNKKKKLQAHHFNITVSLKFRSTELEGFASHKMYIHFYHNQLKIK